MDRYTEGMSKDMSRESTPTILLADDQADVREALRLLLKAEGIASVGVADPAAALEAVRKREFACALIDCNYSRDTTSGEEGLDLLERLRQLAPELPVVAMTAWGNVPLTVAAMRAAIRPIPPSRFPQGAKPRLVRHRVLHDDGVDTPVAPTHC